MVGSRGERTVRNGTTRKPTYNGRLAVVFQIARAVRNGIIAFINRLAVVVSPRNDRVRTNGRTTQKRAQLVVGQVGRAVRNGPLGLFSHGQSPEMSGMSVLHTKKTGGRAKRSTSGAGPVGRSTAFRYVWVEA